MDNLRFCYSEIECKDEIYSASQLQSSVKVERTTPPIPVVVVDSNNNNNNNKNSNNKAKSVPNSPSSKDEPRLQKQQQEPKKKLQPPPIAEIRPLSVTAKLIGNIVDTPPAQSPRLQTATSKLFAPRTEEMSKGFLTFSEEEPGVTSK